MLVHLGFNLYSVLIIPITNPVTANNEELSTKPNSNVYVK